MNIPAEVVHGQDFTMEFFDEDDRRDDEFLGRAKVQTAAVAERGEIQGFWVDLEECESGKAQVLHFLYTYFYGKCRLIIIIIIIVIAAI